VTRSVRRWGRICGRDRRPRPAGRHRRAHPSLQLRCRGGQRHQDQNAQTANVRPRQFRPQGSGILANPALMSGSAARLDRQPSLVSGVHRTGDQPDKRDDRGLCRGPGFALRKRVILHPT